MNSKISGGFPLLPVLFLVFLVLKLTGYIDWSWWWVTAPLWAGISFVVIGAIVFVAVGLIGNSASNRAKKARGK